MYFLPESSEGLEQGALAADRRTRQDPGFFVFDQFELNVAAGELKRTGRRVKLQDLPFRLLVELLKRPNQTVTREALRHQLWPQNEHVEYDRSINTAVRKLRVALGDSPRRSKYIETVPRHGYRFVGSVRPRPAPETIRLRVHGLVVRLRQHLGLREARDRRC
jgi:DNA-binding winged helix-turn-helix (wHTH) protein